MKDSHIPVTGGVWQWAQHEVRPWSGHCYQWLYHSKKSCPLKWFNDYVCWLMGEWCYGWTTHQCTCLQHFPGPGGKKYRILVIIKDNRLLVITYIKIASSAFCHLQTWKKTFFNDFHRQEILPWNNYLHMYHIYYLFIIPNANNSTHWNESFWNFFKC